MSLESVKVYWCIVRISVDVFFKAQYCFLCPEGFLYIYAWAFDRPSLHMCLHAFLPSCPSRFTEWLRSSSWSLGWIICLTNWSGGSIQHLPSCFMVTTRTVTVARWAGTLTADARSGCFKTCCWPFEISFFEGRAETKHHSPCTPIIGSHLGEGSDPHPPPTQESLWGPSTSLPLFIHLRAWPPTPLQSSRFFLVLFSYLILIDILNMRFASQNHASGWPPRGL